MCGIAGITGTDRENAVKRMTDSLLHRGPDDCGYHIDNEIALGQRRLSIIDLVSGKQPIPNEDRTLYLVCNGEIYNSPKLRLQLEQQGHQFKTNTDVEVILHLYEEYDVNCVKHLRGMFAFAIWDIKKRRLFLARDHLGQKPLFFCSSNGAFSFASEAKAILASNIIEPKIDLEGLWHYLSLRFMPEQHSLFSGIQKLPAAHYLLYENQKLTMQRYWDIDFSSKLAGDEMEIVSELDSLLSNTVKEHLLSDVRVGAFLSGGIDSGTIASMMASVSNQPIPRFSIGTKEREFNELPYAELVAQKYGMESHTKVVEPDLINTIPSLIYHMDEPADPFALGVYLVSKLASKHVKVALGGDGGDENFAGYDRYSGQKLVDYYCLMPKWLREGSFNRSLTKFQKHSGTKAWRKRSPG